MSMPYLMPEAKRAESVLQNLDYPLSKDECIEQAIQRGASEDMIAMLEDLPMEAFDSVSDIKVAIQVTKA